MSPCCSHTVDHYYVICKKSLAQKLSDELPFLEKFVYVTFCDLHGHRNSQVMV